LRDEFQNDDNNNDDSAARTAIVSVDAPGPDYMVAEHQPIARASGLRSSDLRLHSARSQWIE